MKSLRDMTEPELEHFMNLLAKATESVMPSGPGPSGRALFALLVFDDPSLVQYVSNARREDMVKAIRELADRLESRQDIPR